jgi:hypothetical protein
VKKSRLNRRTPMRRGKQAPRGLWGSTLNVRSKKKVEEDRDNKPAERHYRLHKMCCLTGKPAMQIHHMPRGTGCRPLAVVDPDTWLAVADSNAHDTVDGYTKAKQVAMKCREVLRAFNHCREGYAHVTKEEIIAEWEKLDG